MELTATHAFRYNVGATLRVGSVEDTGYRFYVIAHTYRDGSFGYMISAENGSAVFYRVDEIEPDYVAVAS